jgi:uncharacterized protein YjbI with pentapeptide repeats
MLKKQFCYVLDEYSLARGLLKSYQSNQQFSPISLEDDDGLILDDSHVSYFINHLKEAYQIKTSEHWEVIAGLLDILSKKVMVKVIDMISRNRDGIEISKIERLVEDNKKVTNALIDAGIIEQDGVNILPGSNLDKALICLEILRSLLAIIEREKEQKRRKKVTIDLNEFDLSGVDLSWSNLTEVDLTGRDLSGANLSGANLSRSNLTGVDLSGANLSGANLSRSNLTGVDLSGANLSGTNLSRSNLTGVDLSGANLSGANLTEVLLAGVDLSGASLSGTNLRRSDLAGADLSGADLSGADLIEVNLTGADLSGADLSEANLFGAFLTGVDLSEAKTTFGANIRRTKQV